LKLSARRPSHSVRPGKRDYSEFTAMRLFLSALCVLASCALLTNGPIFSAQAADASADVLRVGVTPNAPPMIFKQGEALTGVEAELAQALGSDLGRKIVFVELKWEDLIDALCENRIDIIMSAMSITLSRSYRVAFTDPYLNIGQIALTRAGEKYDYVVNLAVCTGKRGLVDRSFGIHDHLTGQNRFFKDGAGEELRRHHPASVVGQ